jgi:hypothetical protein
MSCFIRLSRATALVAYGEIQRSWISFTGVAFR